MGNIQKTRSERKVSEMVSGEVDTMRTATEVSESEISTHALEFAKLAGLAQQQTFALYHEATDGAVKTLMALNKQLGQQVQEANAKIIDLSQSLAEALRKTEPPSEQTMSAARWDRAFDIGQTLIGGLMADRAALPHLEALFATLTPEQFTKLESVLTPEQVAKLSQIGAAVDAVRNGAPS